MHVFQTKLLSQTLLKETILSLSECDFEPHPQSYCYISKTLYQQGGSQVALVNALQMLGLYNDKQADLPLPLVSFIVASIQHINIAIYN